MDRGEGSDSARAATPPSRGAARPTFISTAPPGALNRRFASWTIALAIVGCCAMTPLANIHLVRMAAFIPSYEAAVAVIDLVTAVLLLSQFSILRRKSLLAIACAYFMCALMVTAHALSFPSGPASQGLFGDSQTTAWLYVFWHASFPALVGSYTMLADSSSDGLRAGASTRRTTTVALCGVAVASMVLVLLADAGARALPILIVDGDYRSMVTKGVTPAIVVACFVVIGLMWRRRRRSVMDLWMFATMWVWICDVSLSAVVSSARYDLGWYAGRIFGLVAASILLVALLFEFDKLYARLATAMDEVEARNHELVRSRDALVRVQRFEALGQLTAGIAHDFNNLLTAITGGLEMIARRADDRERVLRHAANAAKAAERGVQLIRRLMSFARKQNLRPAVLDTNQTLREFGALLSGSASAKAGLRFVFEPVGTICVDETEFQAAFLNLVSNARDAMPDGGDIVVSTRMVTLTAADLIEPDGKPGPYVEVAVADTGSGMSPEIQAQVFEPFFTTKAHGLGSGLGLSQVYGFTRSAGGQVVIESAERRGTKVALYLPLSTTSHIERQQVPQAGERASMGLSVLLVEDDVDVLVATKDRVEELGYAVVTATSGDEAWRLLSDGLSVDIVLSDIVMPGKLNGVQLAEAVRGIRPRLKLVLTSGYTGGALDQFHLPHGLLFLPKPYTQKDLAEMLATAATI